MKRLSDIFRKKRKNEEKIVWIIVENLRKGKDAEYISERYKLSLSYVKYIQHKYEMEVLS